MYNIIEISKCAKQTVFIKLFAYLHIVVDGVNGDLMHSGEEDVNRGRLLHRLPQQPAVDELQPTTTSQNISAPQHRRQSSISFDA